MTKLKDMETWWRIELYDGLKVCSGDISLTRFYSQKVSHLLAYLALHCRTLHSREALAEQFWPEADADAARLNLRVGLAALRPQLEPPGVPKGSILIATRDTIRLNPDHTSTDVSDFLAAIVSADKAIDQDERASWLQRADGVAHGELLPGCYEEWALAERRRLDDIRVAVLRRLTMDRELRGDISSALDYAHRTLAYDTLNEESHYQLIRLYLADGQAAAARRQYNELERILHEEFGVKPSETAQSLLKLGATIKPTLATVRPDPGRVVRNPQPAAARSVPAKRNTPHYLPAVPALFTRFFGRDAELDELERLLALPHEYQLHSAAPSLTHNASRIVTLTGTGGAGKTRLALEIGHRLMSAYEGSIRFVSLLEVTTASKIIHTILAANPQGRSADREPFEQVADTLSQKPTLLILDNFEQLLIDEAMAAESAGVIVRMRERCPDLSCLITSRQTLNIDGEYEFAVEPLPTPLHPGVPERLMEFAGVQLFVDRAQAARADFQITPRNAGAIAALCSRLEGLPLALELAAAWARIISPSQMLERLSDRFEMLVSRRRDIPLRHRTLRATIDWSFQLLSPDLQRCFLRLSVFRGGWSVEAAQAVCEDEDVAKPLMSLCESSLIVSQVSEAEHQRSGIYRFSMLESLREYATEQLSTAECAAATQAHAKYFAGLADTAEPNYHKSDAPQWMDRLELERENLQAALDYAFDYGFYDLGAEMAMRLDWFWFTRGYREERKRRMEQVCQYIDRLGNVRARAILWSAHFMNPNEARLHYEQCLAIFEERNDPSGIADAQYGLGSVAAEEHNYNEAARQFARSLSLLRTVGSPESVNAARAALAHVYRELGDIAGAQTMLQEQLASQIVRGNIDGAAKVRIALANIALGQGEYALAESLLQVSLTTYRSLGQKWGIADTFRNLGNVRCALGNYGEGEELLRQSMEMFREIEDWRMVDLLLLDRAEHAMERLDNTRAAEFLQECGQKVDIRGMSDNLARLRVLQGAVALADGLAVTASRLFEEAQQNRYGSSHGIAWCMGAISYRRSLPVPTKLRLSSKFAV